MLANQRIGIGNCTRACVWCHPHIGGTYIVPSARHVRAPAAGTRAGTSSWEWALRLAGFKGSGWEIGAPGLVAWRGSSRP